MTVLNICDTTFEIIAHGRYAGACWFTIVSRWFTLYLLLSTVIL